MDSYVGGGMNSINYLGSMLLLCSFGFISALYFDLKFQKIPNKLCALLIILGGVTQFYFNSLPGLINALFGFCLAFGLLFPFFLLKALGGGDVKLMMALGVVLGPWLLLWSVAYSIICGGITSLVLCIKKTGFAGLKATVVRYYQCFYLRKYFKPSEGEAAALRVPYAPALALGWLWACSQNQAVLWAFSNFRHSL